MLSSLRKPRVWNVFFPEEGNTHNSTASTSTKENTKQTEACLFLGSCRSGPLAPGRGSLWPGAMGPFSIAPNS